MTRNTFILTLVFTSNTLLGGCAEPEVPDANPKVTRTSSAKSTANTGAEKKAGSSFDWPRWRGPNLDGISAEKDWNAKWPSEGPKQLWKKSIGIGFSSVSVADGRLYTMGHKKGPKKIGDDTVFCFNAQTGEEIWKVTYQCNIVDYLHEGGPATTPTVDQGRVYTISKQGQMFCFDAGSGTKIWEQKLMELLGVKMPAWGFSSSPLVVGEKILIEAGRLVALNKKTGKLIWKTDPYKPGYGSPIVFERNGEQLVTSLNNEYLVVVKLDDGSLLEKFPWKTSFDTSATTPLVSGDTIFISTGYNKGCALLKFSGNNLEAVWSNKKMRNHMNNSVLWKGFLYGFDGNSNRGRRVKFTCMDYKTGEVKWTDRSLGCGSLMLAGGKLILLGDSGELVVAEPSSEKFKPISRAKVLGGRCWTVPVLSNGRIYCRNAAGDLVCVDVRKG